MSREPRPRPVRAGDRASSPGATPSPSRSGSTTPDRPAATPDPGGRHDCGPRGRRRRLHRAVDRAAGQGGRPEPSTWWCSRATRSAGRRQGATAGSARPRSPTGSRNGHASASRASSAQLERLGRENLDGHRGRPSSATASTASASAPASSTVAVAPWQVDRPARRSPSSRRRLRRATSSSSTRTQVQAGCTRRRTSGGPARPGRLRARRPGQAGLGSRPGLPTSSGVRIYEHTQVTGLDVRRRRGRPDDAVRVRARAAGGAGHQRVPAAAAPRLARTSSRCTTTSS